MAKIYMLTDELRWYMPHGVQILKQAWRCQSDGIVEWRDVPVVEKEDRYENETI